MSAPWEVRASTTHPTPPRRAKIPDVETLACPRPGTRTGLHVLSNTRSGETICVGCREPWVMLDARARSNQKVTP